MTRSALLLELPLVLADTPSQQIHHTLLADTPY